MGPAAEGAGSFVPTRGKDVCVSVPSCASPRMAGAGAETAVACGERPVASTPPFPLPEAEAGLERWVGLIPGQRFAAVEVSVAAVVREENETVRVARPRHLIVNLVSGSL